MILALLIVVSGCASAIRRVVAMPNREVAALTADDIVRIMRRAGIADKHIVLYGADLRNSLAQQGAAQFRSGSKVEAVLAVHSPYVHVISRSTGSFVYNYKTGEIQ